MNKFHIIVISMLVIISLSQFNSIAFPTSVFPLLPSEFYYKPRPSESVIFGLVVVKILAIRLASILGLLPIPYHLNDLFFRKKRSLSYSKNPITRSLILPRMRELDLAKSVQQQRLSSEEVANEHYRLNKKDLHKFFQILWGLRHIVDTKNCFMKTLCTISHRHYRLPNVFDMNSLIINVLRYLISREKIMNIYNDGKKNESAVMDAYEKAIKTGRNPNEATCHFVYDQCPLLSS